MAKIVIELKLDKFHEQYKEYCDDCENFGNEIPTLEDYLKFPMEEFISKVYGRIDNTSVFSIKEAKFSVIGDDNDIEFEKKI
jgi:hypothetical protein